MLKMKILFPNPVSILLETTKELRNANSELCDINSKKTAISLCKIDSFLEIFCKL